MPPEGSPTLQSGGRRIGGGPQVGQAATYPLPPRGSPPLQSGGENQEWRTSGPDGDIPPAVWGVPTASQRGAEAEVAKNWAG